MLFPLETPGGAAPGARIDKWLWTVRVFKTRVDATEACRAGAVEIAALAVKPSREVRSGDMISVRQGVVTRTLRVVGSPRARVGAKLVPDYCEELTPPAEFEKAREQRIQHVLAREQGSGRPTKRDRREIERFFE